MNYLRHLYKRHLPEYIFKCTGHFVHLVNSLLPPTPKSSNTSEKKHLDTLGLAVILVLKVLHSHNTHGGKVF